MTILDLPILSKIEAHWLSSKPLDSKFATAIQETDFYLETRRINPDWWTMHENKLAQLLKFNAGKPAVIKESAIEQYGQDVIDNAQRYMTIIINRSNIQPIALQYAAIAWFIDQMIDIDKTKELNNWEWTVKEAKKTEVKKTT